MNTQNVKYVLKVLEPDTEYLLDVVDVDLESCKRRAQEYLWNCPDQTQYIYLSTRYAPLTEPYISRHK